MGTNSLESEKQIGRINPQINKQVYIEPLYSISSSKIINHMNNLDNSKKRNNSVITGLKYEIKTCQTTNGNSNEEYEKIKKKDNKKMSNIKNEKHEQSTSRYLINVNLAKKKHNKIQSLNDFTGIKMSLSNSKKNQISSSFMRDNIKNMKSLLQFSNHHNHKSNK